MPRWCVIGPGVMASALTARAAAQGRLTPDDAIFADCDASRLEPFSRQGYRVTTDNAEAARGARYVLLGVRPHQAHDAVRGIASEMAGKTLVSICAGITTASLKALLPDDAEVARVMPNLPATVGAGVTAIAADGIRPDALEEIKVLLACSGTLVVLEESLLDAATAVSGSGPGYCFRFAAALQAEAERLGLPPEAARLMIAGTLEGAARMLREPEADASELARHVAVPGGTTEAAFQVLDRYDFDTAVRAAVSRCAQRAGELAK
ncbi:MAG: pyrroline-5-carboxylate reductase [Oscillospiraceae bacterium]|nr:pyrroline-5-carboxylate reductase [Oscillospiraceae bacterium]